MTKEDWLKVKKGLESQYRIVKLNVDGYEVSLALSRISTYKLAIAIYINGVFRGKWLQEDCEERRRFLQKKERDILSKKEKDKFNKLPKKMQKELTVKYPMKYEYFSSVWSSFGALKKHLISNNETIDLVSIT